MAKSTYLIAFVHLVLITGVAQAATLSAISIATPVSCIAISSGPSDPNGRVQDVPKILSDLASLKIRVEALREKGIDSGNSILFTSLSHEFSRRFDLIFQDLLFRQMVKDRAEFVAMLKPFIAANFSKQDSRNRRNRTAESKSRKQQDEALLFVNHATKIRFHDIKPGSFTFKRDNHKRRVGRAHVDIPFAMMDTDVTQAAWVWLSFLMGETRASRLNPSDHKFEEAAEYEFQTATLGNATVDMLTNVPVESFSDADLERFISGLNRLSMSEDENVHAEIRRILPDHRKGSLYDLPTLDQIVFVQGNRGLNINTYFDSNLSDDVTQYSWTSAETSVTKPVKLKEPRMIDTGYGKLVPFFDLTGNVWKLTRSTYVKEDSDPLDAPPHVKALAGGSVSESTLGSSLGYVFSSTEDRKSITGLRLVQYAPEHRAEIESRQFTETEEKSRRIRELDRAKTYVNNVNQISKSAEKLEFVDIKSGQFTLIVDEGLGSRALTQVEATLKRDFAMATTPLTQFVWSRVQLALGVKDRDQINPADFNDERTSLLIAANGVQFSARPNNPIENVSPDDATRWLQGLNQLSESDDSNIQALLQDLIVGHQIGDRYDLPTLAQVGFVVQNRGLNNQAYFDRDDEGEIDKYSWHYWNSFRQTQPVKLLAPRMIQTGYGKTVAFHDLIGNVQVMVKDPIVDDYEKEYEKHGIILRDDFDESPHSRKRLTTCGASALNSPDLMRHLRLGEIDDSGSPHVGIRLVRYRKYLGK